MIGGLLRSKQCCFSGLVVSLVSEVNWSRKTKTNMNKVVRIVDDFSLGKKFVFDPNELYFLTRGPVHSGSTSLMRPQTR